jgi:hypothetical protein
VIIVHNIYLVNIKDKIHSKNPNKICLTPNHKYQNHVYQDNHRVRFFFLRHLSNHLIYQDLIQEEQKMLLLKNLKIKRKKKKKK